MSKWARSGKRFSHVAKGLEQILVCRVSNGVADLALLEGSIQRFEVTA